MNFLKQKPKYIAFVLASVVLLVFCLLNANVYFPLGSNIMDNSGDGLKNLYTFGYYLKYGDGLLFKGMLYPFGDHITYMDAQPLYVWLIWILDAVFKFKTDNPIVFIHLIILTNIYFAAYFIFLILKHFKTSNLIAIIGTIVIVLLSPQMYRTGDHFALASVGIIPFFWWWRLTITNSARQYFLFSILLSLVGFIHPYLLFMLVLLLLSYEFFRILIFRNKFIYLLFPIISFVLFYGVILLTDTAKNRPVTAWGAKQFSCKWYELLLPLNGIVKDYFTQHIKHIEQGYTEGHAYITVFGIFVLLYLLYNVVKKYNSFFAIKKEENAALLWFLAAIPILLFAFYLPFRWNETLFAPINPFKQFRGTGRFVFVFYYVYLVYVFVVIDKLYHQNKKGFKILFWLMVVITVYDINNAYLYLNIKNTKYGKTDAYNFYKNYTTKLLKNATNIAEYESIIVYPPSTEGTEKVWIDNDWDVKINSFWLSFFSGLPMANIHSSRVDFNDAMEIYQLSGFYTMPKPILQKFNPNKKQLLLLQQNRLNDNIPLVQKATLIDTLDNMALMEIDLKKIKTSTTQATWVDSTYTLIASKWSNTKAGILINNQTNILSVDFINNHYKKIRILFWYTPNYFKNATVPICSLYKLTENNQEYFIKDWRETHTDTYNYKEGWLCIDYELNAEMLSNKLLLKLDGKQFFVKDFSIYAK